MHFLAIFEYWLRSDNGLTRKRSEYSIHCQPMVKLSRLDMKIEPPPYSPFLVKNEVSFCNGLGYTTVAVKTLKDSAGSAELADLLSEYQLLKKVDHKNVIKLLGACTAPGGSVYIIIEYCALGSLRAHLRLHRNLKTNADMGARIPENSLITSNDMMSFAYQISKGMAYLADIKLVHRDLAARNILLTEEKICKISDFGLTRDVYEDDTYLKQSRGRVPVKWMAVESLGEHIYTTQSDVWSFGVVLWELVTLGASPYPGVTLQNLYHLLKNGYRMQRPANCSKELYEVMRKCWYEDPDERPTFASLVDQFGRMLEKGMDYVNFSIQMISNPAYFNPQDLQDDDAQEMNITFKMELKSLTGSSVNNNRYENYSVTPNTSYDTPRMPEQVQLIQTAT
ncbi:proto-oncogene tyrosine-protein kinase receptor Ret-like [Nesidiocoris tenuis]|uniref:Proto-oncogene tyrosine-protein kinase receptor Ret-like n=1 Tax=Nesidiocoris tenuis TaxID=355587 RepID=A0ABN7ALH3_9HEMI|nr:proto-oncogene tyrosine-protein kinase receptor Ret-like [Nesidiocoris tenuis]